MNTMIGMLGHHQQRRIHDSCLIYDEHAYILIGAFCFASTSMQRLPVLLSALLPRLLCSRSWQDRHRAGRGRLSIVGRPRVITTRHGRTAPRDHISA